MPHYFFDLRQNGESTRISVTELDDGAMAREYAIGLVQTLFSDQPSQGKSIASYIVYGDESNQRNTPMGWDLFTDDEAFDKDQRQQM